MQSQDQNSRTADAMNHPDAAEWMAFQYGEVATERKRALRAHLAQCPACREQNKAWSQGIAALDEWKLPELRPAQSRWQPMPVLKWAVAVVVILAVGFALGRQNSNAAGEIASLKDSVSQLAGKLEQQRAASAADAAVVAGREVAQLLADYSKLDEEQRTLDRKAVALALREMEGHIVKLRTELETVAVNTESGFRQTQQGLTQLASFTANEGNVSEFPNTESKNH